MSEIVKKFIADRFDGKEGFSVNPDNIGDSREFAQELGSFCINCIIYQQRGRST